MKNHSVSTIRSALYQSPNRPRSKSLQFGQIIEGQSFLQELTKYSYTPKSTYFRTLSIEFLQKFDVVSQLRQINYVVLIFGIQIFTEFYFLYLFEVSNKLYNKQLMIKRDSLLRVHFNAKKQLVLSWNFRKELQNDYYFRHLIFLDSVSEDIAKTFIKQYFKNLKSGDLMAIARRKHFIFQKSLRWREKTLQSQPKFSNCDSDIGSLSQLLRCIEDNIFQYRDQPNPETLIFTIYTERNTESLKALVKQLIDLRTKEKNFKFQIIFFGSCLCTTIDSQTGMIFLRYDLIEKNYEQTMESYKSYLQKIQFARVQLSIQCQNGNIACQQKFPWDNDGFNKITRNIYFPYWKRQEERILLYDSNGCRQLDISLCLTLEYTDLSGNAYKSCKNIKIECSNDLQYSRTFQSRSSLKNSSSLQLSSLLEKEQNNEEMFVWFKKISISKGVSTEK